MERVTVREGAWDASVGVLIHSNQIDFLIPNLILNVTCVNCFNGEDRV